MSAVPPRVVGDVMTPAPVVLHVTHSVRAAQRMFASKGFQHLPVIQDGRLVGIVSDRDISAFLAGRPHVADLEVGLAMTQDPVSVSPAALLDDAAELLVRHSFHSLPVIDDEGRLIGIVTATDLLRVLILIIKARGVLAAQDAFPEDR